MKRNITCTTLTKDYILSKVSQVTIFSAYLNLSNAVVQHCIDSGELICSPLREDIHPTCGFRYDNRGKLKFRDFSGFFWGDCFDLVAFVMGGIYNKQYDISNKQDFIKVLRHITFTFKDIFYGKERDINLINEINASIANIKHSKPIIELVTREWNKYDESYWNTFGITLQFLNINFVYAVDQYYINRNINPEPKYYYDIKDPCYAYLLGRDKSGIYNIKLYFPRRSKSTTRFITNCNHLEGIYNLDRNDYDVIVLTKSTKDRLAIGSTLRRLNPSTGKLNASVGVINVPHETYRLRQIEYDWMKNKLKDDGKIVSLMDNDRTGKSEAIWLRDNYNIIPIIIPAKYHAKDFAELVSIHFNKIKDMIMDTLNYIKTYDRKDYKFTWDSEERCDDLPY